MTDTDKINQIKKLTDKLELDIEKFMEDGTWELYNRTVNNLRERYVEKIARILYK